MKPSWDAGWWYIATITYDRDEYPEAANAFGVATKLRPKSGLAWLMLGLCQYRLKLYDDAATNIIIGNKLGFPQDEELRSVVMYHVGALNLYRGEFEAALLRLDNLAFSNVKYENLYLALGLGVLRIPKVPEQLVASDPDYAMIRQAGYAEYQSAQNNMQDAEREYARLAADYPTAPWVYYAYGLFKAKARDDTGALEWFHKAIETTPTNALARIQIAYIMLNRNQQQEGIPYAEEAVRLYPRYAQGHFLLGRLLYDTGQNDRALSELETARDQAPDEPKVYYALARAYEKAGRKEDARKARELFVKYNQEQEERNRAPGLKDTPPSGVPVQP